MSLEDWRAAVGKAVTMARSGDAGSRSWLAQYLEERKTMMAQWADYLDTLREGEGNVVALRRARPEAAEK